MMNCVLLCILVLLVLCQLVDCRTNRKKNCRGKYLCNSYKYGPKSSCKCIDRTRMCDGVRDCPGSDDEENCPCLPLPNPFKGRVDLTEGTKVNNVAKFFCNEGYTIFGPPTRTCMSSGAWSGASPTCQKAGCDCNNKRALTGIPMPVNGGGDVLTRQQFNNIVVERFWVGVYDMIGINDMGLGHLYDFRQTYSGQLAAGNYANMFMWRPTRGSIGDCQTVGANILPLSENWVINDVIDLNYNQTDVLFEIYISSCPDQYVWLFDCFDSEARKTGTCPVDQTLLLLTVPETNNNVSMDDLPWDVIIRDLYVNSNNTVAFCKQSNMEAKYLLGAKSCKSTGDQ